MKILIPSFFRMEKNIEKGIALFFWGFILLSLFFLGERVYSFLQRADEGERSSISAVKKERVQKFEPKIVIAGPLALKENERSPFALALELWFDLKGVGSRPDKEKEKSVFCIGLRGSVEERIVEERGVLYVEVKCDEKRERIEKVRFLGPLEEIGKGALRLGFSCSKLDKDHVFLKQQEGEDLGLELFLPVLKISGTETLPSAFVSLKEMTWWGKDLLFAEYGAEKYFPLSQNYRLDIKEGPLRSIVYVKQGDFLLYREGRWEAFDKLPLDSFHFPLAQIVIADGNILEIRGWNVEGVAVLETQIFPAKGKRTKTSVENFFKGARLRSQTQVSCRLGKKHLVLKKGDWIVKTKGGWHKLKTLSDLESVLSHKIEAELLVVDEIDPKGFLKGHYFDEMRVQKASFVIPLLFNEKKKGKKKKEKEI